ncbi:MAG: hypothetical protein LBU10_01270 [Endomicrobium sp.]|jgi:hypothetical protein|nr:hypothetical protein [Endomicrobium sp.]
MKKIVMPTIISMTILTNVFANGTKPIETLENKNEVCVVIDKVILRRYYYKDKDGKTQMPDAAFGEWVTDFNVVADYYRYIVKDNRLGFGLGITMSPLLQLCDIYGVTKIKVPFTNRCFLGVGAGFLGNLPTQGGVKINHHEFFKLFTCFNFKNMSIHLSYTKNILYEKSFNENIDFMSIFEALNLGIVTRFTI